MIIALEILDAEVHDAIVKYSPPRYESPVVAPTSRCTSMVSKEASKVHSPMSLRHCVLRCPSVQPICNPSCCGLVMLRASHRALRWLVVDASRRVTTASFSSHSDIPQLFPSFPQDRGRIFSGAPSLGPLLWPRSECSMSACTIGSRSFCTEDSVLTVSSNLILAAHSRCSPHASPHVFEDLSGLKLLSLSQNGSDDMHARVC